MKMNKVTVLEELDTLLLLEQEIQNNYFSTVNEFVTLDELITFSRIVPRQITKHNVGIFLIPGNTNSHSISLGVKLSSSRTYGLDLQQDEEGHFTVVGYRFISSDTKSISFENMLELEAFLSVLGTPKITEEDKIILEVLSAFKNPTQEILDKIAEIKRKVALPVNFTEYLELSEEEKARYPLFWESWTNYYSTSTRNFLCGLSKTFQNEQDDYVVESNKLSNIKKEFEVVSPYETIVEVPKSETKPLNEKKELKQDSKETSYPDVIEVLLGGGTKPVDQVLLKLNEVLNT